jgi:hypothetical protein
VKAIHETPFNKGEAAMSTLSMWKFRASLSAAVLAVASLAPACHAQTRWTSTQVNVPFAFEYGSQHFDAGLYTISMPVEHLISIQGKAGHGLAYMVPDIDSQPAKTGKVVFRKYGNRYFLREMWTVGATNHLHCVQSKAERQAERLELASNQTTPTGVELALLESPR